MANLNSEAILASSSYVCGERKGNPHARARSPRLASPGRHTRARDVRMNGPPKSGFLLLFYFLVAWLLGL